MRGTVKTDAVTAHLLRSLAEEEDRAQTTVLRRAVQLYAALEPADRFRALAALELRAAGHEADLRLTIPSRKEEVTP